MSGEVFPIEGEHFIWVCLGWDLIWSKCVTLAISKKLQLSMYQMQRKAAGVIKGMILQEQSETAVLDMSERLARREM